MKIRLFIIIGLVVVLAGLIIGGMIWKQKAGPSEGLQSAPEGGADEAVKTVEIETGWNAIVTDAVTLSSSKVKQKKGEISISLGKHPVLIEKKGEEIFSSGLNEQFGFFIVEGFYDSEYFSFVSQANAGVVNLGHVFAWDRIEPEAGNYDFSRADEIMNAANSAGIKIIPIISPVRGMPGSQQISCGGYKCYVSTELPSGSDLEAFGNMCYELAKRYKQVEYWMLMNEPNTMAMKYDTKQYADMLKKFAEKIREANPNAKIMAGAAVLNADRDNSGLQLPKFFQEVFSYYNKVDAFEYHYYDSAYSGDKTSYKNISEITAKIKSQLSSYGINVPIFLETAHCCLKEGSERPEAVPGKCKGLAVSEEDEAIDLVRRYTTSFVSGIDKIIWIVLRDGDNGPIYATSKNGLINEQGKKEKSFYTYQLLAKKLKGFSSVKKVSENPYIYEFIVEGKEIYVAWQDDGGTTPLSSTSGTGGATPGPGTGTGGLPGVGKCGDGVCDEVERQTGRCPKDCGGTYGGTLPGAGKCGDGVCDEVEKAHPELCPEDCQ